MNEKKRISKGEKALIIGSIILVVLFCLVEFIIKFNTTKNGTEFTAECIKSEVVNTSQHDYYYKSTFKILTPKEMKGKTFTDRIKYKEGIKVKGKYSGNVYVITEILE